jgi:fumarylpyruvate hydrolase
MVTMTTPTTIFSPAPTVCVPIAGNDKTFPVRRVYCVGRNYAEHAKEMGATGRELPFFFTKPADAVVATYTTNNTSDKVAAIQIAYPSLTQDYHHEVELVIAIGEYTSANVHTDADVNTDVNTDAAHTGRNIAVCDAHHYIYGYAVGLDMTRRDLQAQMKQAARPWCIAKAVDQSAPIGSITPAAQYCPDTLTQASIALSVNGVLRQSSQLHQMIWSVEEIIAHVSSAWTLQAGDLIFTGTPAGVGAVVAGDVIEASISGLTPLTVHII